MTFPVTSSLVRLTIILGICCDAIANKDSHERLGSSHKYGASHTESFSLAILTPKKMSNSLYSGLSAVHSGRAAALQSSVSKNGDEQYPESVYNVKNSLTGKYNESKNKLNLHERRKLAWKRSRKTRRHEKSTAFHTHHRHYAQEMPVEKEPSFDESSPSIVTAQLGSNAFLSCKIHDLQDKSVSWIRNKDAHILTVDRYIFISDSRFVSWFDPESETWTLQVKFTTPEDAGRYECQVSTEPKRSHFVTLIVVVPKVVIPGGTELHVRSGSDVLLKCVISRVLTSPPYVFWYHNEKRVPENNRRDLVHQAPLKKVTKDSSVASLSIKNVNQRHAGNYTCAPAGITTAASVILHVLNGEHPAAMQHGSNEAPTFSLISSTTSLCFIIHIFFKLKISLMA